VIAYPFRKRHGRGFPARGNPHGIHQSAVDAGPDASSIRLFESGFDLLEDPSVRAVYKRIPTNLTPSADTDEALRALGRKKSETRS